MKYLQIFVLLLPILSFGQGNLVPNPSFEDTYSCPPGVSSNLAGGGVLQIWVKPNTSTPDYFNECAFPLSPLQIPHFDSAYIGLATYDPNGSNQREYVACSLLDSLSFDSYYWVEFYTSVGEGYTSVTSNNLGIHFSDTALHSTNPYNFDVVTQVKYFNNEIIDDTINWVKVCGIYQAHGGESFITIGNFNTDAETTEGMNYNLGFDWQTYFLIDDVSVIPLDSIPGGIPVDAGPDKTIYIGDTTFIGQKISNMPDMWFELNGTPVDTNTAGVYVSPSVNTTYVVTRNLNGFYSTDTVTVFVNGLGLGESTKYRFTSSPNPSIGQIQLKGEANEALSAKIISQTGKVVFVQELNIGVNNHVLNTQLSAGSYILIIENEHVAVVYREKMIVR